MILSRKNNIARQTAFSDGFVDAVFQEDNTPFMWKLDQACGKIEVVLKNCCHPLLFRVTFAKSDYNPCNENTSSSDTDVKFGFFITNETNPTIKNYGDGQVTKIESVPFFFNNNNKRLSELWQSNLSFTISEHAMDKSQVPLRFSVYASNKGYIKC